MAENKKYKFETRAIHVPPVDGDNSGSVTTPIFPSSTYRMKFPGDESGYVYARWANPTRIALERTLASLEQGTRGFAFASGLSAQTTLLHLLKAGDHIVAVSDLYGGTHRQFEQVMKNFDLHFDYVDGRDPQDFKNAIKDNTRLFWLETPTNPLMYLIDIEAVSKIAKEHNIMTAVDNTFASPYIQNPLTLGADVVAHSMSKYISGHCDVIAGALIVSDNELGDRIRFHQNALGGILSPFDSWLTLRGLKTLGIRMKQHTASAIKIIDFLKTEKQVKKIYYPGLDGKPMPNKMNLTGGMISFEIDADFDTVKKFVMSTKLFILAESLGGVESLINHPSSMTHSSIPVDIRQKNGITDSLVRLSVGIEDVDDLLDDLKSAFGQILV